MAHHPTEPAIRRITLTEVERRAMTSAVLARTTGSACQRMLTLIGGEPDGPLNEQTQALMTGHLDHCAGCRATAATLVETREVLASFAELDPGADFAAQVVAATAGHKRLAWRRTGARSSGLLGWIQVGRGRVAVAWERMLARPRLSLELAYLATVLLVLVVGNPGLIADALGARTSGLVIRTAGAPPTGDALAADATKVASLPVPAFVERVMREVSNRQTAAAKGWDWFVERTSRLLSVSWDWLRGVLEWIGLHQTLPASTEPSEPPVRVSQ
jgi:hypothetical protein